MRSPSDEARTRYGDLITHLTEHDSGAVTVTLIGGTRIYIAPHTTSHPYVPLTTRCARAWSRTQGAMRSAAGTYLTSPSPWRWSAQRPARCQPVPT